MKTRKLMIMLGLLLLAAIYACSGVSTPKGAHKIGRYEGTFSSAPLSGSCRFDLYRLPDGSGMFEGAFQGMETDVFLTLEGDMIGNHLEGTVTGEDVFGGSTVSGDLSPDENEVTGTFSLNAPYSPEGTFTAKRK
ncbi:MAG: hypothetical protein WAL90_15235 [Desulfobacterales bacterium]